MNILPFDKKDLKRHFFSFLFFMHGRILLSREKLGISDCMIEGNKKPSKKKKSVPVNDLIIFKHVFFSFSFFLLKKTDFAFLSVGNVNYNNFVFPFQRNRVLFKLKMRNNAELNLFHLQFIHSRVLSYFINLPCKVIIACFCAQN